MIKAITAFLLLITAPFCYANSNEFQTQQLITEMLPGAQVGLFLYDLEADKVLFEQNANQHFFPASNVKLFLSSAALAVLGKNHRFYTRIHYNSKQFQNQSLADNLYFVFKGDPSFKAEDVSNMLKELHQKGIKTITGDIIIDNTLIQDPEYAPGWTLDSQYWYYAAPIGSIIINENKINFSINADKKKPVFKQTSRIPKYQLNQNVNLVPKSETKRDCQLNIEQTDKNITLSGCWPKERIPSTLSFAIREPDTLLVLLIKDALKEHHIQLKGQIRFGKNPDNLPAMVVKSSPPLKLMLPHILADSNNVYTEALTKALGLALYGRAAFQSGAAAISDAIHNHYDIDMTHANLEDGSGQSRYDYISPYLAALLLQKMYQSEHKALYQKSLSQPGKPGQLSFRFKDKQWQGKLFAKTGSAIGTSALSGYYFQDNKPYIFSVMINHAHLDYYQLKRVEEKLVAQLFENISLNS